MTTVMDSPLATLNFATVPPMETPVAPVKPVPAIVTAVPPVVGPAVGEMESMAGAGPAGEYVNLSAADTALVPVVVCTVMSTTPAAAAGAVTVRLVAVAAVTVPATVPNFTLSLAIVVSKPVPVIVTAVPPMVGPVAGEMAVTVGATA